MIFSRVLSGSASHSTILVGMALLVQPGEGGPQEGSPGHHRHLEPGKGRGRWDGSALGAMGEQLSLTFAEDGTIIARKNGKTNKARPALATSPRNHPRDRPG